MNSFVTLPPAGVAPCGKQVRPGSPVVTIVINNSSPLSFYLLPLNLTVTLLVFTSYFLLPTSYFYSLQVENIGVEPMTSCLQSRRSSQLS